ncbi:MAG: hypothetical protein NTW93_04565 [Phycisphaerae bacterium]|nr:hypothetical protein [Phycisphaerae bacterium]
MAEDAKKQDQLIETTDCLEAIGTLKSNKNFFFLVCFLCLLILQGIFWLVPTQYVEKPGKEIVQQDASPVVEISQLAARAEKEKAIKIEKKTEKTEKAAQELAADVNTEPNEPNTPVPAKTITIPPLKIKFSQLSWLIRFCNYLLVVCSVIYSLTLLFCMKISLVGRLGGIRHITKAVFVSFFMIVLLLPWQIIFKGVITGAIYTPTELLDAWTGFDQTRVIANMVMFLRFTGLWLVVIILLCWAQLKSMRWSKNTLKRLGIIA